MGLATRASDQPSPTIVAEKSGAHRRLSRRPTRGFQVIGALILVLGAVVGVYAGVAGSLSAEPSSAAPFVPNPDRDVPQEKAVLRARAIAADAAEAAAAQARRAEEVAKRNAERAASRSQARSTYPVPESCNEYDGNRALGCALLLDADYDLDQMPCLERLWTKESNWNPKSHNGSSGAHGIPQALPGNKMAKFGEDWATNPVTQIKWGLYYIENRYKTPCNAWSHFQSHNWY